MWFPLKFYLSEARSGYLSSEPTRIKLLRNFNGAGIFPTCPVGSPEATPLGFFGSFCFLKGSDNFKFFFELIITHLRKFYNQILFFSDKYLLQILKKKSIFEFS